MPRVPFRSAVGTTRRKACSSPEISAQILGKQIDRQEVHGVHQEDPEEHREGNGSNELAGFGAMHDALGLVGNHFDENFDGGLKTARHAGSGRAGGFDQDQQA